MVHSADTREQARSDLIDRWDRDRQASPDSSRIILTHTNAEVRELRLDRVSADRGGIDSATTGRAKPVARELALRPFVFDEGCFTLLLQRSTKQALPDRQWTMPPTLNSRIQSARQQTMRRERWKIGSIGE